MSVDGISHQTFERAPGIVLGTPSYRKCCLGVGTRKEQEGLEKERWTWKNEILGRKREGADGGLTFDDTTALPNSLIWAHIHLVHRGQQLLVGLQGQVHPAKVDGKG